MGVQTRSSGRSILFAGDAEQHCAKQYEHELNRINLEGKIKARMQKTTQDRNPSKRDKKAVGPKAAGKKPAHRDEHARREQQRDANPAERDEKLEPVIVQLRRQVAVRRIA